MYEPFQTHTVRELLGAGRPLPDAPTDALPLTEEKARVMQERLRRGQQLHHPRDRQLGDD